MYRIRELIDMAVHNQEVRADKRWHPARPLPDPFITRVRDAWAVLVGRADAVRWD